MAKVSQNIKYVKLDDGVSFSLVRTNPKLTTNTKLMYNGKRMYMESYTSSELLNRSTYKNVSVKQNSTYNKDIASFLTGSGSQAYSVYQNFSDTTISDSYDNQFETLYWCGAEYIESSFYDEEIGFVAPLYLREKLPNYFLIFRLDTPSNYNLVVGEDGKPKDPTFDFKTDILDKAVLIKTFDLREGTVLGNYIRNYIEQELFEFDKSIYVNFANAEVTYYGIDKISGVLEKRVESFENELLRSDNPVLKNDEWFTEGFERNGLIFPYIMNIEYLFNDDNFKHNGEESYDFARYIGVYCNNIEIGEFTNLNELSNFGNAADNAIYYFEDNKKNLHRYTSKIMSESSESEIEFELKIDGKDVEEFDVDLISGFERERMTGYAEPLDIYEGFINRAQYGFEILKPLEPGDWIGIEYNGHAECYFADDTNVDNTTNATNHYDMSIGEYSDFRFSVNENGTVNDIAEALVKSINHNKKSKFEAKYSQNVVVIYAKREGKEYNDAKILIDASLLYNRKISLPISNYVKLVSGSEYPVEDISDSDLVKPAINFDNIDNISEEPSSFGDYYMDYFCGACDVDINQSMGTYKNIFKIYNDEYIFFGVDRYLKTNNGNGRRICSNMMYINSEGKIDPEYRLIIVDDAPNGKGGDIEYDISVSSTYQVEIMDLFKPNHGILSWFPVKDFDFDINYSLYGDYRAFVDECYNISKKVTYTSTHHIKDTYVDSDSHSTQENIFSGVISLAKSPFFDDFGNNLESEYDYYLEQFHPDLCLLSKTVPYISKWGYYDEQKDSCENPYRLNVSKVFGVSNLSANTYLKDCEESQYTHNMPYYMTLCTPDYHKEYQYIASDDIYIAHNDKNKSQNITNISDSEYSFFDCVDYWVNTFKNTDVDMFSYFFSGKKYGKRFDRKYSRILGGDKFHNPSTLFRGIKFEVIRQYNGVEKRSSEYNDYKFSFVYIPVMINSIIFSNKVYFVKNDTFKFIVGIIFVNSMLGLYEHNIFNGSIDYFSKGFLYASCKKLIRPESSERNTYNLTLTYNTSDNNSLDLLERIYNVVWERNYDIGSEKNEFYMWKSFDGEKIFVTKTRDVESVTDIIGECNGIKDIENIKPIGEGYTLSGINKNTGGEDEFEVLWMRYYKEYDATIHGYFNFEYCGSISCEINIPDIALNNNVLIDVCDIEWKYFDENDSIGYIVDVANMRVASQSLQNILINMGISDSIYSIKFYNIDGKINESEEVIEFINKTSNGVENKDGNCKIDVDIYSGNIEISEVESNKTKLYSYGNHGENIENLRMDIVIVDKFDTNFESLGLKDYFSVFKQISMYNITESINNDYNVKYYSTVEDNKYKIRVIEPDCIEVEDKFESTPLEIIQKNKKIIGGVNIGKKINSDKIGIKVINRYSGFYNPIFNDILYYDDYTYTTRVGKIGDVKFELPYSNTNIDYNYNDIYGRFGIIKNIYYHKTNINRSDKILSLNKPIYPLINEYALDYRDYNIFSSSWDEGYFISQDDLDISSICTGIGSMKEGLCMFGSKYLNLPDDIFIDTFDNVQIWDEKMSTGLKDNTDVEIMHKEINDKTVKWQLFIEKRLKRHLKEKLMNVFSKYINKKYSFGNKGIIEDDVEEYVEKNLLRLYAVDKVYMYIKSEPMRVNDKLIENEYEKFVNMNNELKIKNGFPIVFKNNVTMLKDYPFSMTKINEFDRIITYNLKSGFKESFGFAVSFRRK